VEAHNKGIDYLARRKKREEEILGGRGTRGWASKTGTWGGLGMLSPANLNGGQDLSMIEFRLEKTPVEELGKKRLKREVVD